MHSNFFCKNPYINLYEKPSYKSKIASQILYGEKFNILSKKKKFIKIKNSYDGYVGYIKSSKYITKFKPSHKIITLKSRIFKGPNNLLKYRSNSFLPFSSKIQVLKKDKNYVMFKKNKWIKRKDLVLINKKDKNFIKIFKSYLNCKYKWGGKTYNGIDCSALLQIFYKFNNKFFPRDTIDQIKFKNGFKNKKKYKFGDIIFWKGHVAICINSKKLIHAYGPKKKVVIMQIDKTINKIEKTANLKVKKVCRI